MNDSSNIESLDWSTWLDFNEVTVLTIPESEGVYKMHARMKILYIGCDYNIRKSLLELLSDTCINKATRFSYAFTKFSEKTKEFLLNEYRVKHNGKIPICMES